MKYKYRNMESNITTKTYRFSWNQKFCEKLLLVLLIYTQRKRLFSIFLFTACLKQCGWETVVFFFLILLPLTGQCGFHAYSGNTTIADVTHWSMHSPCSTRWWALASSWPHLWYDSSWTGSSLEDGRQKNDLEEQTTQSWRRELVCCYRSQQERNIL